MRITVDGATFRQCKNRLREVVEILGPGSNTQLIENNQKGVGVPMIADLLWAPQCRSYDLGVLPVFRAHLRLGGNDLGKVATLLLSPDTGPLSAARKVSNSVSATRVA